MDLRITVEDRLEIFDLLARYNWAIDCDDADAFVTTFADDGEFVTKDKVYKGHADLRDLMVHLHQKRDGDAQRSLFHNVSNVVLERIDDDHIRFVGQLIGPRISSSDVHTLQLGWYDDVLTRTGAGWRFGRRHFRIWPDAAPTSSPVPFAASSV